jgi:hypothetical protein
MSCFWDRSRRSVFRCHQNKNKMPFDNFRLMRPCRSGKEGCQKWFESDYICTYLRLQEKNILIRVAFSNALALVSLKFARTLHVCRGAEVGEKRRLRFSKLDRLRHSLIMSCNNWPEKSKFMHFLYWAKINTPVYLCMHLMWMQQIDLLTL